jgi:hypothetical protein
MARLTLSSRNTVCARLHLLEHSLRLDITARRSRNLRLTAHAFPLGSTTYSFEALDGIPAIGEYQLFTEMTASR